METQYLISNQTSTPLYANNGTHYVPLPAFSVNTAILTKDPISITIGTTKDSTTGPPLYSANHYVYIQQREDRDVIYACIRGVVTATWKTNYQQVYVQEMPDTVTPSTGTACSPSSGGAWNFEVDSDPKALGFVDALPIATVQEDPDSGDGSWSTTTWVLIIAGVLLLLAILGMIIYFATRKPKTPTVDKPEA